MKLRQFREITARYAGETELLVESIDDGSRHSVTGLNEDWLHSGKGKELALCLMPEGVPRGWEYERTTASCGQVGVDKAVKPVPPDGEGWEMVSVIYLGESTNEFWYWWKRRA